MCIRKFGSWRCSGSCQARHRAAGNAAESTLEGRGVAAKGCLAALALYIVNLTHNFLRRALSGGSSGSATGFAWLGADGIRSGRVTVKAVRGSTSFSRG